MGPQLEFVELESSAAAVVDQPEDRDVDMDLELRTYASPNYPQRPEVHVGTQTLLHSSVS